MARKRDDEMELRLCKTDVFCYFVVNSKKVEGSGKWRILLKMKGITKINPSRLFDERNLEKETVNFSNRPSTLNGKSDRDNQLDFRSTRLLLLRRHLRCWKVENAREGTFFHCSISFHRELGKTRLD